MAEKIVGDEEAANKNLLDFHYKLMEILKNGQQIDKDTYKTLGEQFNIPDYQDPAVFFWIAQQTMEEALFMRYSLAPFWHTLHYRTMTASEALLQPFHFEFSSDSKTLGIDRQFLIGRAILVSPNLDSTATTVHVYIPDDVWYQFPLGVKVKHAGVFTDLDVLLEKINAHIPGSFIIPMKIPGTNLIAGRGNPFTSPVA
ncbi:unnamed protein product [Rotaria magnacalcarata]